MSTQLEETLKLNLMCGLALAALFSGSVGAQTCANPYGSWHPGIGGTVPLQGTTCGAETALISACDGAFGAPGAAYVASISTTAEAPYTQIAVDGDAGSFTPTLYVVRTSAPNACNTAAGDTGICQTSSSVGVLATNIPPGQYYLIVTGADFDAPGSCGAFTLTADGPLPVSLQSFTVG